jgi:hypothetical protein
MSPAPSPAQAIAQMASGYWVSQALYVAAKLAIADFLASGPKGAAELAVECGANPAALYRLLRALASLGVFAEIDGQRFELTPLAQALRSDVPESKRAMVLMTGEEQYRAWGELLYTVTTGKKGFDRVFGKPLFDYLAERPEQAALFDAAMVSIHGRETPAMIAAYDFSSLGTLADLGGGNGSVLIAILAANPTLRGILFDLPNVVARATANIAASGLANRCQTIGGSFFESVPAANAYLMRHIIHDWDDERSQAILRNIHRTAPAGAKLLVVESVIRPGNDPDFVKLLDLTMLVIPGGQERNEEEYRRLLSASGFDLQRIVPTDTGVSILEAVKVG